MKTSRVGRVVQILTTLHSGRDYSSGDISKMFGTSRRTVFRDLKELASIGVPYRYNAKTKGYAIDPEFFLPPINLNVREALSLLMLVHKVRNQVQLPFKSAALLAALKIENNLPAQIRRYCNSTLRCISTKSPAQAPTELLDKRFAELQEVIVKKQKVMLCYASLFDGKTIDSEVCPYHLLYNQRAWYLLGYSLSHRAVRTFKLNRIKELKVLGEQFSHGDDFDAQEYVGRAWSMIPEGRIYDVKLRFSPKVASNVTEVHWHSTQSVTHNKDGSAIMEFRVDGLGEIAWWILGYGDQVQIIAPRQLRRHICDIASNMVRLNSGT